MSKALVGVVVCLGLAVLPSVAQPPRWVLVIHGGAGAEEALTLDRQKAYEGGLSQALAIGKDSLKNGGTALDTCEKVIRTMEDEPLFNAGKGAVYTADGKHELDASIMDGKTLACGAVAGVSTIKNPITLARLVMTKTRHVLLTAAGAEKFADEMKVERVPNSYFDTPEKYAEFQRWQKKQAEPVKGGSTVGCVCLDTHGNLAAATSTGGLTGKKFGRVGDSPIIGAGTFADNRSCAVSCTGTGEEFIRHGVARSIAHLMEYKGMSAKAAADEVMFKVLKPGIGGCIVVSHTGEVATSFNTNAMFRGVADSTGRSLVAIFPEGK
ncbi:MAG: isoaspartyl peptidase/L-asparaginase [Gemmataceae bacterium]